MGAYIWTWKSSVLGSLLYSSKSHFWLMRLLLLTRAFVIVYFQDCVQLFSHPVPSNHDRDWTHGHRRSSETTTTTDPTRARSCSFGRGQRPIAAHACLRNVKSFLLNVACTCFVKKLSECRRKVTFKYKKANLFKQFNSWDYLVVKLIRRRCSTNWSQIHGEVLCYIKLGK